MLKISDRQYDLLLFLTLCFAALFRFFAWHAYGLPSDFELLGKVWPDEGTYFNVSKFIIDNGIVNYLFSEQSVMLAPGNPLYLAFLYVLGFSVNAIRAVNVMLSVLTIFFIYRIGCHAYNKPAALLAAIICSVNYQLIKYSPTLLTEPIFIFSLVFLVHLLQIYLNSTKVSSLVFFLIVGVVTVSVFVRSIAILLPIAIFSGFFVSDTVDFLKKQRFCWLNTKKLVAVFAIPCLLVGLIHLKNYTVFDRPIFATGSGAALWLGSRADTLGDDPGLLALPYGDAVITGGLSHISIEGDQRLTAAAKANILQRPIEYAYWSVKKIGRLLIGNQQTWFFPGGVNGNIFTWYRIDKPNFFDLFNKVFQMLLTILVVVYGIVGLCIVRIDSAKNLQYLLICLVLYMIIFSLPFLAIQRYGLPVLTFLTLPASYFFIECFRRLSVQRNIGILLFAFSLVLFFELL